MNSLNKFKEGLESWKMAQRYSLNSSSMANGGGIFEKSNWRLQENSWLQPMLYVSYNDKEYFFFKTKKSEGLKVESNQRNIYWVFFFIFLFMNFEKTPNSSSMVHQASIKGDYELCGIGRKRIHEDIKVWSGLITMSNKGWFCAKMGMQLRRRIVKLLAHTKSFCQNDFLNLRGR